MRTLPEHTFSAEEKQRALDAVLKSRTFARTEQLKKYLRYVCDMEEAGRAEEITEYSIGTDALGRPRSYSPAADSGVRGRAHDLRQKLEQFYKVENPSATVRIGLRKGSYTPFFYEAEPKLITEPLFLESVPPAPLIRRTPLRALGVNVLLMLITVLATRAFYMQRAGSARSLNSFGVRLRVPVLRFYCAWEHLPRSLSSLFLKVRIIIFFVL